MSEQKLVRFDWAMKSLLRNKSNYDIKEGSTSKNIQKVEEKLNVLKMDKESRKKYERYIEKLVSELDMIETSREEGELIRQMITALNLIKKGFSNEETAEISELSIKQIETLQKLYNQHKELAYDMIRKMVIEL